MVMLRGVLILSLLSGVAAVTPIEKVISLIENLKQEVEKEGRDEAGAYDKFSCFCKATTNSKVSSINKQHDEINENSADIADKTQDQTNKATELVERKKKQAKLSSDLDDTNARCAKEKAEYEAEAADLSKAIQGLKDAIKSMKGSKPSLLQIQTSLKDTLGMAEAMGSPRAHSVMALLGVDPEDPKYKFHSDEIIDLCVKLLGEYKDEKASLDAEFKKSSKACAEMKASLKKQIGANAAAMKQLQKDIQRLAKEIAEHREDLITADEQLKDDEQYLNDLTARCEARANDYDQRSAMRGGELAALTGALEVLTKKVKGRADKVNVRAAFVQNASAPSSGKVAAVASKEVTAVSVPKKDTTVKAVSFLQEASRKGLRGRGGLSQEARMARVGSALAVLKAEGQRIGSLTLMSLSARLSAPRFDSAPATDPFKKIKGLIQKLIERLLQESANEATKKGFCDTELAKAEKERDFRWQDANDLSATLASLEAKEDELVQEIKELTRDIKDETQALKETTKERKEEKEVNLETLSVAKDGLAAVNEAILILRTFYKQAAKASLLQASPVDEDTQGPGFDGNYKGSQGKSNAVFALLETIASDFDRTLRTTEEAEHNAHREFVAFDQSSQSSIAAKTTKKELDTQDLKTTRTSNKQASEDLQTAVDLMDKALEELEELKPTCTDTGMSYSDRVAARKEEMKALEKALCILDEDKVEPECRR